MNPERISLAMRKFIVIKIAPVLFLTALLAACASHVKVENSWRNTGVPEATYKKVLVVGITQNKPMRELFENILTETLNDHGVTAVASHTLLADLGKADKVQLQTVARAVGADAVLITQGLSKSENTSVRYFGGSIQERTAEMFSADENSSTTVFMSAVGIAPLETDFTKGSLQTRLFKAASAEMAWSALVNFVNDGRKADACWDFSNQLTQALAKDRLIEINDRSFKKPSL